MKTLSYLCSALSLALLTTACSDNDASTNPPENVGTPEAAWIAKLDPMRGELPEGLIVDPTGEKALVGLAPTGQILAIEIQTGAVSVFGNVPALPPNEAYLLGLAFGADGSVLAGVASSSSYPPGIYKIAPSGGTATLFASHEGLRFPNGLTFAPGGRLFVTDSISGTIFTVEPDGAVQSWVSDPLLRGDMQGPCANGAAFPIGANGIVLKGDAVFTVNTDMGSMLRIPIHADGSAGPVSTFAASDCDVLGGADGLALGASGDFFVAANAINAVTRVSANGEAHVLSQSQEFDFPATPWVTEGKSGPVLFVTNAALKSAQGAGQAARPGLLRLSIDR